MDLAETLGGQSLDEHNKLKQVGLDRLLELKDPSRAWHRADVYTRWAKWFFADRQTSSNFPPRLAQPFP